MCHPLALVGCCEGRLHCAGHMATGQSGLPPASGHAHGAVASVRFPRGLAWLAWQYVLEVGIYPTEGELLPCFMACLLEGVVVKASVVAMIVQDLDSVLCSILFKGKLCGECFIGLVVELEVDKTEVAIVVDEDGGTFVALLGEFAFQLCKKTHFR
jgi:hypothetical protein